MEKEIELLTEVEAALLLLMAQYQSGQYVTLGKCISNVRAVRETLRHLTLVAGDNAPAPHVCETCRHGQCPDMCATCNPRCD